MAVTEERRQYLRQKKREQRARARAHGKCIVCVRNDAPAGFATCAECRENIIDWQRDNGWPRSKALSSN